MSLEIFLCTSLEAENLFKVKIGINKGMDKLVARPRKEMRIKTKI